MSTMTASAPIGSQRPWYLEQFTPHLCLYVLKSSHHTVPLSQLTQATKGNSTHGAQDPLLPPQPDSSPALSVSMCIHPSRSVLCSKPSQVALRTNELEEAIELTFTARYLSLPSMTQTTSPLHLPLSLPSEPPKLPTCLGEINIPAKFRQTLVHTNTSKHWFGSATCVQLPRTKPFLIRVSSTPFLFYRAPTARTWIAPSSVILK